MRRPIYCKCSRSRVKGRGHTVTLRRQKLYLAMWCFGRLNQATDRCGCTCTCPEQWNSEI